LGLSGTAAITMNDSAVRTLFGVASGAIGMNSMDMVSQINLLFLLHQIKQMQIYGHLLLMLDGIKLQHL
jgi:hypothetical protein